MRGRRPCQRVPLARRTTPTAIRSTTKAASFPASTILAAWSATSTTARVTVLADKWQGKPLNAPNDIVVHPDGGIWFTDPGYGILVAYEGHQDKMEIKEAVYRIDRKTGKMDKVTDDMYKPNGLCFSPDYTKLYICDTGATHYPEAPKNIRVYDVADARALRNGKQFVSMDLPGKGAGMADGIRADAQGNIWAGAGWVGAGLRRGPHLRAGRRAHRADPPAGDLRQPVFRRAASQPPVHGGQPVHLCFIRRGDRRSYRLRNSSMKSLLLLAAAPTALRAGEDHAAGQRKDLGRDRRQAVHRLLDRPRDAQAVPGPAADRVRHRRDPRLSDAARHPGRVA